MLLGLSLTKRKRAAHPLLSKEQVEEGECRPEEKEEEEEDAAATAGSITRAPVDRPFVAGVCGLLSSMAFVVVVSLETFMSVRS